jgi:hypothetical protein
MMNVVYKRSNSMVRKPWTPMTMTYVGQITDVMKGASRTVPDGPGKNPQN